MDTFHRSVMIIVNSTWSNLIQLIRVAIQCLVTICPRKYKTKRTSFCDNLITRTKEKYRE